MTAASLIRTARIVCLVENRSGRAGLRAEHGLCLWLELDGARILFDTGQSDACCYNARRLGANLPKTDAVVLSHGHYDHTGGLFHVLTVAPAARVFAHPAVLQRRYACQAGKAPRYIGIPSASEASIERARRHCVSTERPTEVRPGVFVTGSVPRTNGFETVSARFYSDRNGNIQDPLPDDQAMYFECEKGLVVVFGCAHAGVVNTLDYIAELTGQRRVYCVLGGLHLRSVPEDRLKKTAECFEDLKVEYLFAGHCTGEHVEQFFMREFSGRCGSLRVATRLSISARGLVHKQ